MSTPGAAASASPVSHYQPTAARLHVVSGKGGVGKTLVATALARHLAATGEPTLLVSFEPAGVAHPCLEGPVEYQPRAVAANLSIARVDARAALREYVRRKMSLSLVYEGVLANPLVGRFLDALPLFDELMCLGKLYDLTTHPDSPFAHVVFDAPASGHCQRLLSVPEVAVNTLVAGPVYHSAGLILEMLRDPALTELIVVTLPEETPVRETLELHSYARDQAQLARAVTVVNRCVAATVRSEELALLDSAQQPGLEPLLTALRLERSIAAEQAVQLAQLRSGLGGASAVLLQLPELIAADDAELAVALQQQLAALLT